MDVRERPAEKESQADEAHAGFDEPDSDFLTLLNIWHRLREYGKDGRSWQRNRLPTGTQLLVSLVTFTQL